MYIICICVYKHKSVAILAQAAQFVTVCLYRTSTESVLYGKCRVLSMPSSWITVAGKEIQNPWRVPAAISQREFLMRTLRDQLTVASCDAITAEWVKHVVPDIDFRIRACHLSQAESWAATFPDPISWSELTRRMSANVYVFENVEDDSVSGESMVEEDDSMSGETVG